MRTVLRTPWTWTALAAAAAVVMGGLAAWAFARGEGADAGPQLASPEALRQPVHWHADFRVVIRGEAFEFDDPRFISTEERELSPNVHIHAPRHNVVHVHREQTTWGEFFESLGVGLTQACLRLPGRGEFCSDERERLRFFVNGVEVDDIRFLPIADLQRVLVYYGPEDAEAVAARFDEWVSDEACIVSGLCQGRIPPEGLENEPCAIGGAACH
ncbi:hypothetical protein HRbin29_01601 [bacterium HR29]|jgi:hypothetical protein|nr:hypothetical protein HRbin29_01601 [bacterium HR29]